MGITKGFAILAKEKNELTDKLVTCLKNKEKEITDYYHIQEDGVYPNEWFVKNSHFSKKCKSELKLFIEVSFKNRIFTYNGKKTEYDISTFDEFVKVIGDEGGELYLFPFLVNSGIKKTKPKDMLSKWKGKLI
jgi:hypothetical protein